MLDTLSLQFIRNECVDHDDGGCSTGTLLRVRKPTLSLRAGRRACQPEELAVLLSFGSVESEFIERGVPAAEEPLGSTRVELDREFQREEVAGDEGATALDQDDT